MNTPKTAQKLSQRIFFASITGLTAAALLVGCTSTASSPQSAPSSQDISTQNTEPSATAEPTNKLSSTDITREPPAYPLNIASRSPENAIRFTEYYIRLLNYASQTGDTVALRESSAESCGPCMNWVEVIDQTYSEGSQIIDFQLTTAASPELTHSVPPAYVFAVKLSFHEYWIETSAGEQKARNTAEELQADILPSFEDGKWTIMNLGNYEG